MSAPALRDGLLRWGILGAGLVAHRFAHDLGEVADARLEAVAARSAERAQQAAQAMGASAGVAGREALLARDLDVVYVATPTWRRREDCLAVLAAGKALVCEKPFAPSTAEGREIAAAARAAGLFCMEGLWTQFLPAVAEAERLLAAGAVGAPQFMAASFGLPTLPLAAGSAAANAAGAMLDRGCYPLSLALRLFGSPSRVEGEVVRGPSGLDLAGTAVLSFADGRRAVLAASLVSQLENRIFIGGDGGALELDDITCPTRLRLRRTAGGAPAAQTWDRKQRAREALRRAVRGSSLLGGLRELAVARGRGRPCRGFGYVHEIEEAQSCLRAGRLESATHPLSRSLETLDLIEAVLGAAQGTP